MARVIHFEIQADHPDRAMEFYRQAFQWDFKRWKGPIDYWFIQTGSTEQSGINGGLVRRKGEVEVGAVSAYVCTVDVEILEDSVQRVVQAGGRVVVTRFAVPGYGWMVYCRDTEGNLFAMIQKDPQAI